MNVLPRLDTYVVRESARGRWRSEIYPALGIAVRPDKRHGPCPHCGGKDRFRCDDKDGRGTYFCNGCGAGDGFVLIQRMRGCDFPEALRIVATVLGLDASTSIDRAELQRRKAERERARLIEEQQHESEGRVLDQLREAEHLLRVAKGLTIEEFSDNQLDHYLDSIANAHDLLRKEMGEECYVEFCLSLG
jgi:phage/plasmid primase-like uncharacterized protein